MAIFEQEGVHVISLGSLGMGVQPHVSHPAYPTVRVDEQGVAFDGKLSSHEPTSHPW